MKFYILKNKEDGKLRYISIDSLGSKYKTINKMIYSLSHNNPLKHLYLYLV